MPTPTPDADVALITLAQAKTFLKITASDEDQLLCDFISRAGDFANTYTGRHLKSKEWTEYYDGDGSAILQVRNYPITTLTSLNDDSLRTWTSATDKDVSADVMLDGPAGIIRLWNNGGRFLRGRGNVRVVYTAGYKDATNNLVPYDLQEASLLIVMHTYKRVYQDQRIGLQSETIGQRTLSYKDDAIPPKAKLILDSYVGINQPTYGF